MKALSNLPAALVQAQHVAADMQSASKCSGSDYNRFSVVESGLEIPQISQEVFDSCYKNILCNQEFQTMLQEVRQGKEVQDVQPLTKRLLELRLLATGAQQSLSVGTEVGFHTTSYKRKGFSDKAACPVGTSPDAHRPSTHNVANFDSPVVLLGSWEDKGLGNSLGHNEVAELLCCMAGFVEGARRTHKVQFSRFGGILVGVKEYETDGASEKRIVCRCVLWCLTEEGEEYRVTSDLLQTQSEVASGVEWWINEAERQRQTWEHQSPALLTLVTHQGQNLKVIPERGSAHECAEDREGPSEPGCMGDSSDLRMLSGVGTATTNRQMRLDEHIVTIKSRNFDMNSREGMNSQTVRWVMSSAL